MIDYFDTLDAGFLISNIHTLFHNCVLAALMDQKAHQDNLLQNSNKFSNTTNTNKYHSTTDNYSLPKIRGIRSPESIPVKILNALKFRTFII